MGLDDSAIQRIRIRLRNEVNYTRAWHWMDERLQGPSNEKVAGMLMALSYLEAEVDGVFITTMATGLPQPPPGEEDDEEDED